MATNGIQVPVSLYIENLQKIINDLKGQLGNLKVGSSGFKAMENHIRTLQKELDKFQVQASKPFTTENQFAAAEKSVNKLEDEIERISITASRLKFSDLELNGEQKAQLKAVEDQINAIKASLKAAKDEARKNFLSSDLGKQWIDLNPSEATRTLDQITNNIRKAVDDQNKQVQRAKETVDEYKRTITMGDIAQNVAKSTRGLKSDKSSAGLEALMGKEFSDFFTKRANGDVAGFKAGQRGFFAEWLTKNFTIDPTIVKDLVSKTAPEIARVLNDAQSTIRQELNKAIANADTAKVNLPAANVAVSDAEAKVQALIPYLQQAMQATDGLKISEDSLREALAAAGITLENTKESIAANVRGSQEWSNVNQRATVELENLKNTLSQTNAQFLQQQRVTQNFNAMKMAVVNFMGFRQVLNLTKTAIREAINHIKELDSVMNKISIVTDMSTEDLWQQVDQYSKMAQAYGTTIKGAYEVSQIYYQQGLETNDVLTLTNETLKLAKVSGLDYATTTDYMTTALRGFKMEMSEASKVVDVYSNLAAHTAVSSEELAVAMSKTASSMESVGSTFEETSAMIGTMVAVTRESATNIGSALKSIASRYGEMKSDPLKLVDSEGDEMSFNKVDAALQSVGISMKTVDGQFRSFTDVIIELSEKWDQLESTQQRYIATQFAGNRQQSRFLALVSNPELLKANLGYAEESEDTGTLQALKALDSIESKLNQVQVAYQQFYTTLGAENVWKGLLDGTKNVINTLNNLPKLFGKIPIGAIAVVSNILTLIKGLLTRGIQGVAAIWTNALKNSGAEASTQGQNIGRNLMQNITTEVKAGTPAVQAALRAALSLQDQQPTNNIVPLNARQQQLFQIGTTDLNNKKYAWGKLAENYTQNGMMSEAELASAQKAAAEGNENAYKEAIERSNEAIRQQNGLLRNNTDELNNNNNANKNNQQTGTSFFNKLQDGNSKLNRGLLSTAMALTTVGMVLDKSSAAGRIASGVFTGLGGVLQTGTSAARVFAGDWSALPQLVMGVINIINGFGIAIESPAERLERLVKEAEELSNKAKEAKANYRTLDNSIKKVKELTEKRYESIEATEEYQTAADELAESFPQLIAGFDSAGNVIIDMTDAERILAEARQATTQATYKAIQAEKDAQIQQQNITAGKIRDKLREVSENQVISKPQTTFNSDKINDLIGEGSEYFRNNRANLSREDILDYFSYNNDQANELLSKYYDELKETWDLDKLNNDLQNHLFSNNKEDAEIKEALEQLFNVPVTLDEEITAIMEEAAFLSGADLTDPKNINRIGQLNKRINELESSSPGAFKSTLFEKDGVLDQLMSYVSEFTSGNETLESLSRQEISLWQQVQAAKNNAWEHVFKSDALVSIATSYLNNLSRGQDWNTFIANEDNLAKVTEFENKLASLYDQLNLDPEKLQQFEKMSSDSTNYSAQDIINYFKITDSDIISAINEKYTKTIDLIHQSLKSNLAASLEIEDAELDKKYNNQQLSKFYTEYYESINLATTATERTYLTNILDSYQNLISQGYTGRAEAVGDAALDIFNKIINVENPILQKQLWNTVNEVGLNTLEGIEKIKTIIKNDKNLSDVINLDPFLDILSANIIPNINLEIQSATSNLLDTWEDTSKDLSAAMKGGVSLKDADALIKKAESLGLDEPITLDDFQLSGDKLILTRDAYKRYYEGLNAANEAAAESWQEHVQAAEQWKTFMISRQSTLHVARGQLEQMRADLAAIGFDYTQYLGEDGRITVEGVKALQDALEDSQKKLVYYNKTAQIAADQLNNAEDRRNGIYKLHANDLNALTKTELEDIVSDNTLGWEGDDITKRAIKEDITSLYSGLISDVLSKGFKNINLKDYEGLINSDIVELSGSYKDFAEKYAKLAGMTVDETNDLLLEAIEKDRETKAEDLIKDLTFVNEGVFRSSRESLNKIANAFDKPIEELILKAGAVFDKSTQEYIVDIQKLSDYGVDLTTVDNFKITVQESIDSLFNSLSSNIKNALGGSLDSKGTKNLVDTLKQIGLNTELSFTKTKDGYKASTESVVELYRELEKVDSITAQIVLDELNESLDDATIKANGLQKEIDQLRATTESDSFKFMSNKIPSGQNNPINYYENWATALQKFRDALKQTTTVTDYKTGKKEKKKGLIDYQDWYNIITEMGKLADISEEPVKIGNRFLANSKEAQDLLEQSASALTVDSSGKMKIALSDIADLGIDFSSGAKDMAKNVDEAIRTYALSQVKMLDGMIKLMETVVAMEKLGDVDTDHDNKLDLGEIFEFGDLEKAASNLDKVTEFTQTYRDSITKLIEWGNSDAGKGFKESAEQMKISWNGADITMWDLLNTSEATVMSWSDELKGNYASIISAFYEAAKSGNYNLDNILSSVKEVLAGTNYNGDIDIGDLHLTFHQGAILERDKDGNYLVEGTPYKELDTALKAQAAGAVATIKDAVKSYDPKNGDVTFTAGEFSYVSRINIDNKYEVEFSNGDKVVSDTKEGVNFAIQAWAANNNLSTEDFSENTSTVHSFTYTSKNGVILNYEVDVETGEVTLISSNGANGQATAEDINRIESQIDSYGKKFKQDIEESIDTTTNTTIDGNITATLEEDAKIEADVSKNTLTLKGTPKDTKLEGDVEVNSLEGDVTQNVVLEKNETGAALDDNIKKAAKDVTQNIAYVSNKVIEAVAANVQYGKDHPVIQELISKHTTISDDSNSDAPDTNHVTIVRQGGGAGISRTKEKQATGNVGLAKGTLMGELGPELVVSNGHYFVAGQNGAEFVNLDADAIVFNHLQTKALLEKGMSSGRGKAVTSEKNAISYATGNVNDGPAMAGGASAALAALKQLRAQWQALAGLSAKDLAGKGGGGGGGGDPKAFVKELEKWYNWLQKIAQLEKEISLEEAKRSKYSSSMTARGREYVDSQLETLGKLKEQAATQMSLNAAQKEYFEDRKKELNEKGAFRALYEFDDNGQLKYKPGKLAELSELSGRDSITGKANYTAKEQYDKLVAMGYGDQMKYDSSGNEIKQEGEDWYTNAIQAFWDKIEAEQQEMQSLHDDMLDGEQKEEELQTQMNEIMHEIEDNQISVENKVLNAIEDTRQREIDELQKERDAIEESANNLIDGLSDQLSKERDMYQRQQDSDELSKLQRQLGILQRSGGSASQIASLQKEITAKQQDAYFDAQQAQIDALQEASDNELERLDRQIDLMTEQLAYEKENGLLWNEVYNVMSGTPEQITDFITSHDSQYWGQSPTDLAKNTRDVLVEAEKYVEFRDKVTQGIDQLVADNSEAAIESKANEVTAAGDAAAEASSTVAANLEASVNENNNKDTIDDKKDGYRVDYTVRGFGDHNTQVTRKGYGIGRTLKNAQAAAEKNAQTKMSDLDRPTVNYSKPYKYKYDIGGMVDETGPALLHAKEGVLTAEQTSILRNDILSNKPTSLLSLLTDFRDAYNSMPSASAYTSIGSNNDGIIIENATVEMHVARIANDYDAQRAGEQALDKMLQIARKTSAQNRIGR